MYFCIAGYPENFGTIQQQTFVDNTTDTEDESLVPSFHVPASALSAASGDQGGSGTCVSMLHTVLSVNPYAEIDDAKYVLFLSLSN